MSEREQSRFNQLVVKMVGDINRRIDDCFANISTVDSETNAENIYRVASPGGVSAFAGTIATLPGGATLTYNITSGQEGAMVPSATTQLAKMRLYNTTRGTFALILNCDVATNTITLTESAPIGWAITDVITIASQIVSGGGYNWTDLEITSGPMGKRALFIRYQINSATAGDALRTHPFETFGAGKLFGVDAQAAGVTNNGGADLLKITNNVFSLTWSGSPTVVLIREAGYIL